MRKDVGLGTCNSCDYFQINDKDVWLIEETDLQQTQSDLKKKPEYRRLNNSERRELIDKLIRDENRLKVYGSMLILCRLAAKSECASNKLKDKPVTFLLIDSHVQHDEGLRYFDNISAKLSGDLKSLLSAEIVEGVQILNSKMMLKKLSEYPPPGPIES